ncbi:MAG: bacillithiol biosynthesis BshC [Planctomycetota bacterium]
MSSLRDELIARSKLASELFVQPLGWEALRDRAQQVTALPAATIDVIESSQEHLARDESREAAIEKLRSGAAVIVTGQQPGLLGGPTLVDFKIATALVLARDLDAIGLPCVTIFWNASEDHDLDEANRIFLRRTQREQTNLARLDFPQDRKALHRVLLGDEHRRALQNLFAESGEQLGSERELPRNCENLGEWMSRVLAERFAGQGLLVVEPRQLFKLGSDLVRKAACEAEIFQNLFETQTKKIEAAGFGRQIEPTSSEQTWLFVDHPQGRKRLRRSGGGFVFGDNKISNFNDLEETLQAEGANFSCSAHLRPLFQQQVLGPIAQVSGPAEIAYAAQLQTLFSELNLEAPMLWPRFSGAWISMREAETLKSLGIEEQQVFDGSLEEVLKTKAQEFDWPPGWHRRQEQLSTHRQRYLAANAEPADRNDELTTALASYLASEAKAFTNFNKKLEKLHRRLNRENLSRLTKIGESLRPKGQDQDRIRSLACYPGAGNKLVKKLLRQLDPKDHQPRLVLFDEP